MNTGFYLLIASSVILSALIILQYKKNLPLIKCYVLTPGLGVFFLIYILLWFGSRGKMFISWDEFSHWGLVVKNMHALNDFAITETSTTIFKGYPPGASLFAYFYTRFSSEFWDSYAILAMNLMTLSLMLPLFKKINSKNLLGGIILVFISLFIPISFNETAYNNVYVDVLLGLLFGYILYAYYESISQDRKTALYIKILLAIFVLSITKASGFGLSVIAVLVMALDSIIRKEKNYFIVIGSFLSAFVSNKSWSIFLKITGTSEAWETSSINLKNILLLFSSNNPPYRVTTYNNFISSFTGEKYFGYLLEYTPLQLLLGFVFLAFIYTCFLKRRKNEARRVNARWILCFTIGGYIIYSFSLLLLYLFTYSEYEAVNLASFPRYMSTYLTGMLYLFVAVLIKDCSNKINYVSLVILLILSFNIDPSPIHDISIRAPIAIKKSRMVQASFQIMKNKTAELSNKKAKLFFVFQNSNGYHYHVARYVITPVMITQPFGTWSLGEPYGDSDIWTRNLSVDELKKILIDDKYTHIYLQNIDEKFINTYGALFEDEGEIQNDSLYEIHVNNDDVIITYLK